MEVNKENKDAEKLESEDNQGLESSNPSESIEPSPSQPSVDTEEEELETMTVKQVGVKWGLINGIIGILLFLVLAITGLIYDSSVSWISIIPFIVILVLAHREFKNEGDSFMSYSQGLGIGFYVAAVSSTLSSLFTYIYIKFIDTAYYENINAALIEQWEDQGMTEDQIETAMGFTSNMQNPELGILFGILAGVFFGFLVSLVVAAITKKSNPELEM